MLIFIYCFCQAEEMTAIIERLNDEVVHHLKEISHHTKEMESKIAQLRNIHNIQLQVKLGKYI